MVMRHTAHLALADRLPLRTPGEAAHVDRVRRAGTIGSVRGVAGTGASIFPLSARD